MGNATVAKELPETSIWHGAISEDDVALVRRRHAEKVEEWLDYADFATELFALHEKYGIEKGEEGYFAYRKHLRTSYYEKLYTYGPTPDPLDEGCDCIFCRMHADEPPTETEREVKTETVIHSTASGECELPDAISNQQGTQEKSKARRLGQVPVESPIDSALPPDQTPLPMPASIPITKPGSKKLRPVPAYEKIDDETGPYVTTEHVPAESPAASTRQEERRRREKRYGPDPVYVKTAGEKAWLKKKSSSVF